MKTKSKGKKPRMHFNKTYTIKCEKGHGVKDIVTALLAEGYSRDVPNCPICGSQLIEGAIN